MDETNQNTQNNGTSSDDTAVFVLDPHPVDGQDSDPTPYLILDSSSDVDLPEDMTQ